MNEIDPAARRLLRRIAVCFLVVVVTLPLVMFGGQWNWILLADIAVAVYAFRLVLQLRAIMHLRGSDGPTRSE